MACGGGVRGGIGGDSPALWYNGPPQEDVEVVSGAPAGSTEGAGASGVPVAGGASTVAVRVGEVAGVGVAAGVEVREDTTPVDVAPAASRRGSI
jgi:hypothetical protein